MRFTIHCSDGMAHSQAVCRPGLYAARNRTCQSAGYRSSYRVCGCRWRFLSVRFHSVNGTHINRLPALSPISTVSSISIALPATPSRSRSSFADRVISENRVCVFRRLFTSSTGSIAKALSSFRVRCHGSVMHKPDAASAPCLPSEQFKMEMKRPRESIVAEGQEIIPPPKVPWLILP